MIVVDMFMAGLCDALRTHTRIFCKFTNFWAKTCRIVQISLFEA